VVAISTTANRAALQNTLSMRFRMLLSAWDHASVAGAL
jgi:hypothetical protein